MSNTKDIIVDDKIKAIVFGKFKTGKTWGALTFPRPNVIDFDHGIKTLINPEFVKKYGLKHVEFFQPLRNLDSKGIPKDYNAFDAACKYFDDWMVPSKRDQFDTWVLDSCTTLIDASQDKAVILLGDPAFKGAGSKTYEEAKRTGLLVPKLQDYGSERSMTEQFVRMLKDSGKHVVIICHERELTTDSGSLKGIVPLLTGKSQEDIPIMFDEVYRLESKPKGMENVHVLKTQPATVERVGSRLGVPNDTEWSYEVLSKVINDIRAEQRKLLAGGSPSQSQPPASPSSATAGR